MFLNNAYLQYRFLKLSLIIVVIVLVSSSCDPGEVVVDPPKIEYLRGNNKTGELIITKGDNVNLEWKVTNATGCRLTSVDDALETNNKVVDCTGSEEAKNIQLGITYQISFPSKTGGFTLEKLKIIVEPPKSEMKIVSFEVDKTTIEVGESVNLSWEVENADTCKLGETTSSILMK